MCLWRGGEWLTEGRHRKCSSLRLLLDVEGLRLLWTFMVSLCALAASHSLIRQGGWTSWGRYLGPGDPQSVRAGCGQQAILLPLFPSLISPLWLHSQQLSFRKLSCRDIFLQLSSSNVYGHPFICQECLCPMPVSINHRDEYGRGPGQATAALSIT